MIDIDNWLDVPWFEWFYQILIRYNKVKSLFRVIPHKTSGKITIRERILKNAIQVNWWHLFVNLRKWGIAKTTKLHQIVMWIKEWPCPEWMEVCHYDWNPQNNHPENLRYWTKSDNMQDSVRHGTHHFLGKFGEEAMWAKRVCQFTIAWVFIREWWSTMDIQRELWIANQSISACCTGYGNRKIAGGFMWKYKQDLK